LPHLLEGLGLSDLIAMIVLGVLEGVTEFLPISSTGHLILASEALGQASVGAVTEIVIQLGAVAAVVWFYRGDLVTRVRALRSEDRDTGFWWRLAVAALPAAIVGFALGDLITSHLFEPVVVAMAMIVGGFVLWLVDRYLPERSGPPATRGIDAMSLRQALVIGSIQLVALIPGTSRSASSIVGGLLVGLDRPTATAFSFYLAIPTLGGATLYALLKNLGPLLEDGSLALLAVGVATAFATALIAIRWLLRYVSHHDFRYFALYRVVVGVAILVIIRP